MRIGEWNCDEVCQDCEKENDPVWCLMAMGHMMTDVLEKMVAQDEARVLLAGRNL